MPPYADVMDALLAEGVSVHYGPRVAVSEMTLRVPQGRVVGLLGPNGAGKTSLIEGCLGLRPLASGRVWVQDVALPDALRRGWVGVMLQQGGVPGNVTATAWLRHIGRLFAVEASVPPAGHCELLDRLGIDPSGRVLFKRLSGGEQQRVRLAAALMAPAKLLVLDEPSAGLDPGIRREVLTIIGERRDAGVGILLTTHRMEEIEGLFTPSDELIVMASGRVHDRGSVSEITGAGAGIRLLMSPEATIGPEALVALSDQLQRTLSGSDRFSISGPIAVSRGLQITIGAEATPQVLGAAMDWCASHGFVPLEVRTDTKSLEQAMDPQTDVP